MKFKSVIALFALACLSVPAVSSASDLSEGQDLYIAECKLCHGALDEQVGRDDKDLSQARIQLAMLESSRFVATDFVSAVTAGRRDGNAAVSAVDGKHLAFAPPFGPSLRGIVGRAAGTYPGFDYSETMKATLMGMEWTEAALNVWITNPQAWVPGVYMYYKQPDSEKRRKIILFLKANP